MSSVRTGESFSNQAGMTLVELLVALAVGLLLLGGFFQIFVSSTDSYQTDERLARMQENGRFAIDMITADARLASYRGCSRWSTLNNHLPAGFLFNFDQGVHGNDWQSGTTWSPALDPAVTAPVAGSDILTLYTVLPDTKTTLTAAMATAAADVQLLSGIFSTGGAVLVSDCRKPKDFDIFQVSNITPTMVSGVSHDLLEHKVGGVVENLANAYEKDSDIIGVRSVTYYVRTNAAGNPALYRRRSDNAAAEELIEGVENMQVLYGVDTDDDGAVDAYQTAGTVDGAGLWGQVRAVRVGLLVNSINEIPRGDLDQRSYDVDGLAATGAGGLEYNPTDDRRLRQVIRTTVGIRNRLR